MKHYEFTITGTLPPPTVQPVHNRAAAEGVAKYLIETGQATKVEIREVETVSIVETVSLRASNYVRFLEALAISLLHERANEGITGDIFGIDFNGKTVDYDPYNAIDHIQSKTQIPQTEDVEKLIDYINIGRAINKGD